MKIVSPTGKWNVRNDAAGQGYFGAPRGSRSHNGVDLQCVPGQDVLAPISGRIVREAYPYAGHLEWTGCLIVGDQIRVKMFYMRLLRAIARSLPQDVVQGQVIGTAQDISNKYPGQGMTPHVHMEVEIATDWHLVNPSEYV